MKTVIKSEFTSHPMEEVLGIESGTTVIEYKEVTPDGVTPAPQYDTKDMEIETKLEAIYSAALNTASDMSDQVEQVEGKYKARMGEVTATMLSVALGAVREKRQLKQHKDTLFASATSGGTPHTVNNNLVVADRNEILQMLRDQKKNG